MARKGAWPLINVRRVGGFKESQVGWLSISGGRSAEGKHLSLLGLGLREEDRVDVREDTAGRDGDRAEQLVELLQ